MFVVHYEGRLGEGCDYTIGCNQKTFKLPDHILTMEEAVAYVEADISDHGINRINSAMIYETHSYSKIDMKKIFQRHEKAKADGLREKDEAELKRLKKKLGKS